MPESDGNDVFTETRVLELDVRSSVVVLSLCGLDRGVLLLGSGIYSLTRAFELVGARSVLTTLWSVDDKVTREFMTLFYTMLLNGASMVEAAL
jgi:CHAT domain-containing protein